MYMITRKGTVVCTYTVYHTTGGSGLLDSQAFKSAMTARKFWLVL